MDFDSEEEVESFEITDEDVYNALNVKKRRKFTKEDGIYGMYAQRDSDDEYETRKKDYMRPVNFVSSKKKQQDAEEDVGDESDPDDQDLDAEASQILESRDQKKLSTGGDAAGIGKFQTGALERNKTLQMFTSTVSPDTLPPQTGRTKYGRAQAGSLVERRKRELMVSDKKWGSWERHTSGFGSKMLSKMGYVPGKGLGKKGEGIVNPIKAVKVKELGKASESMPLSHQATAVAEDSEEEEEELMFQRQLAQWKKPGTEGSRAASAGGQRPKYVYKTVDELKKSGQRHLHKMKGVREGLTGLTSSSGDKVKVIDMTGREARVLSGYEELRHSRPKEESAAAGGGGGRVFLPELLHNLNLLVEQTEDQILQSDRKLQYNRDLVINLTHERTMLEEEMAEEEKQIERLTEIMGVVNNFEQHCSSSANMSLHECEEMLSDVQSRYPFEYKIYRLSSLAIAVVFPKLKRFLQSWDMLEDPIGPLALFRQWRELLREDQSSGTMPDSPDQMDPYDRLVWEVWMPNLRQVFCSWSAKRQCSVMVELLENWMPLLPDWVMNNILESMVLPRLQQEVDAWDPTTDTIPTHSWIHPWLPLMEQLLEVLYGPIRFKLASALNNWHPSDSSAYIILKPWVKVFSPEVLEVFLVRTVLPKLTYCLQTLVINPKQQQIAPVEWVLAWKSVIPTHHLVKIFSENFFPKWLQVLSTWLAGNPNYDEVTNWYTGWKSMFSAEFLADPVIKTNFNRALDLMNHAVSGTHLPGMRENVAYFTSSERRKTAQIMAAKGSSLHNALSAPVSVSFKDVVEKTAEDNGILFVPVPGNKRYEGKALYNFGKATIYIDRGVVFTLRNKQWMPVSLESLVEFAS